MGGRKGHEKPLARRWLKIGWDNDNTVTNSIIIFAFILAVGLLAQP